jgi:hypothetical protein
MAKNQTLPITLSANDKGVTFVNADSTTVKDIFIAGANGSILRGISACTTDTSANNVQIFFYDGSTAYLMGTVRVATLSGTDGAVNGVNLLNSTAIPALKTDNAGNKIFALESGQKIQAGVLVAVTAGKTLTLVSVGEDF